MSRCLEGLEVCAAIVIALDATGSAELSELGRRVGFGVVADQSKSYNMQPNCVPFFLLHFGLGDSAKLSLISKIRHSANIEIRYAPIILFIPEGPAHRAVHFIDMGFDDVIRLPETTGVLAERLGLQLGQHVFIEADHYLGPDRRRQEVVERDTVRRKRGGSDHDRLTIVRTPGEGVSILERRHISCGGNPAQRGEQRRADSR